MSQQTLLNKMQTETYQEKASTALIISELQVNQSLQNQNIGTSWTTQEVFPWSTTSWYLKHRRDGMSRLGSSRNVRWSVGGVTNSLCSRAHNLVNLSSLRWGYFDEKAKKMKDIFFEKNEKMYFCQKPEGIIPHDGNFDSTKSSLHTCLTLWGRMVFVSTFSSWKSQLQIEKNWKKFRKTFSLIYLLRKTQSEKNSTSLLA